MQINHSRWFYIIKLYVKLFKIQYIINFELKKYKQEIKTKKKLKYKHQFPKKNITKTIIKTKYITKINAISNFA